MNEKFNDITFLKLWRNIVINRVIFRYVGLYKDNRIKEIDLKELREYGGREFICKLIIKDMGAVKSKNGNLVLKGDLPDNGVLKELDLTFDGIISGDAIPQGVEIIHFSYKDSNQIQLSEFPSSVHTVTNVSLKTPYSDNKIPSSITSLSFLYIDPKQFYDIIIPSTITTLNIDCLKYYKDRLPNTLLPPTSFIPSSVTDLTTFYEEKYKSNLPLIPSTGTINKLTLTLGGYCDFKCGLIPFGVKDLTIDGLEYGVNFHILENSLPSSLTKLDIIFGWESTKDTESKIKPHSIPNSVTDLKIQYNEYPKSYKNLFPSNLTSLDICCKFNKNPPPKVSRLLPKLSDVPMGSMKYLTIDNKVINK